MTLTSSGHIAIGSTTSAGELILGSFTMGGAVLLEYSEPPAPTLIYPIISYNEENEMFQIVSTIKAHPFQIRSLSTGDLATTCTGSITVTVRKYTAGGTVTTDTTSLGSGDISEYSNDMLTFYLTVPASLAATSYDSLEINVSCDEGEGFLMINIVPAPATIATAVWAGTEGAAVHTATTSTLTLAAINAEVDTAISGAALATSAEITALNDLSSADIITAVGTALSTSDALRILDIIMSGTFTLTAGVGGAFTCTYTSRTDLSTIEFTVDADGQRTGTTVTLV